MRHGETENNRLGKFQGSRVDIPLNDTGVQQAEAAAATLTPGRWAKVFSSDLVRAAQTARIIATKLGAPVEEIAEFRERDLGELDGRPRAQYAQEHPEGVQKLLTDMDYAPEGGETRRAVFARFLAGLDRVFRAAGSGDQDRLVLIVAHGGLLDVAVRQLLPAQRPGMLLGNGRAFSLFAEEAESGGMSLGVCHFDVALDECERAWPSPSGRALQALVK
ncbi:histidine phosphatase family protein [Segniliparus rugosus]|uniref:Phosphoglycerate mutase n=1 Tax=Segniliparus rugosus (strain ATCC BAA-974 / DSM 45345 / CCUG 50838 / CIP 108380 / JCM 13579 / CDC 945) TaxID=679197 RepID=E5XKT1_SEGRC|nr:histidine phosphatase family protein [Segniliparus rugosus]EFV15044.2 hypothetical protein HMPREF9336_00100 [Segniliparus rugosus ATCC BAA-974]